MRYQIRLLLHLLCCVWEYVFSPVSLEWTRTLCLVWFYCDCFLYLKDSIIILITDNKKYCMMLHVYVCTVHVSLLVCLFVCLFVCWLVLIPSIFKYQTYAIWDLISPLKSLCCPLKPGKPFRRTLAGRCVWPSLGLMLRCHCEVAAGLPLSPLKPITSYKYSPRSLKCIVSSL